jgi:hypothetical protein
MDGDSMDTPSEATRRLHADGYRANWYAGPDGTLRCDQVDEIVDPSTVAIDHILRFEGQSDPGDELILFALTSPGGARGVYSAAYGAHMPPEDAAVIQVMTHRTGDGSLDDTTPEPSGHD